MLVANLAVNQFPELTHLYITAESWPYSFTELARTLNPALCLTRYKSQLNFMPCFATIQDDELHMLPC